MTNFLFGVFGAVIVLLVLSAGVVLGMYAERQLQQKELHKTVEQATEEQKLKFLAEQNAFEQLLHYNIDTAYGTNSSYEALFGGEERGL